EFCGDDDVFRRSSLNAVREGLPGEVSVEQCDDSANAGYTQPDSQIFRAVGHQQADHIALGHTLGERPAGVPPRAPGEFEVGEALAVGEQRGLVAQPVAQLVDTCGQHALALAGYGRCQFERPEPSPGYGRAWPGSCVNGCARCCAHAVFPASTVMTVPVIFLARSLSRYSTAAATSS